MLIFPILFQSCTWIALAINDDKVRENYLETTRFLLIQTTLNAINRANAEGQIRFTGNTTRKTKGNNRQGFGLIRMMSSGSMSSGSRRLNQTAQRITVSV